MSRCEINFESIDKCGIKVDGESVNGISRIEVDIKAGYLPKVKLTPAILELQFGGRAAVDEYVDSLEPKSAKMILQSIQTSLGMVNPEVVQDRLTATEALMSFIGWLTTRDEVLEIGSTKDCSIWADLVGKFIDANDLNPPRDVWPDNVVCIEEADNEQS